MITVGSLNGRKGLEFGVGTEMEVTELVEEGEACFYNDPDAAAAPAVTADPDITLSYIDEKLHNVLGHFQKDFEGGVSAENLGAKFGGYGSFLPTYQRSPISSQPRTPAKSTQQEGGDHNPLLTSTRLLGHEGAATNIVTRPASSAPSFQDSSKRATTLEITDTPADPLKQRPLKVRIKVGSDNLSTKSNAEIYNGLGLDVSSSSSMEDGPTESSAFSRKRKDALAKSPKSILQIMTSFPVDEGILLSPLPLDLICLTKKEKLRECSGYDDAPDVRRGSSVPMLNGSDPLQNELKTQRQKKPRPVDKDNISWELKNVCNRDLYEELVSNTLKLPLLSDSYDTDNILVGATEVAPTEVQYLNPNQQNFGRRSVSGEANKKHEENEIFEPVNREKPAQVPALVTRSSNEVHHSPFSDELNSKQLRKSSDSDMDKHIFKKKEKNTLLEQYSDGGASTNLRMKSKRVNDQDSFGAAKKAKKPKNESELHNVEDWKPECGGDIVKTGPSSSSGLTTDAAGNDQSSYINRSPLKDSKCDEKDHKKAIKKLSDQVPIPSHDSPLDSKNCDIDTATKKRKLKECKDSQEYGGTVMSIQNGEGDDSIFSKGIFNTSQRVGVRKDEQAEKDLSYPSINGTDGFKRDLGTSQHVTATSNSSLMSGSHKRKTILQEEKSSPVESVSSSPLRVSNVDKLTSGRTSLVEKIDSRDTYIVKGTSGPRQYSDGEDNHERRLGSARKEKSSTVTLHGSHDSAAHAFHNKDASHLSVKTKKPVLHSNEVSNGSYLNGGGDTLGHYGDRQQAPDMCLDEGRKSNNHYHSTQSRSGKSVKGHSSKSKDKIRNTKSEYTEHKSIDSSNASQDPALPYQAKTKHGKNKAEKRNAHKRDSGGKLSDIKLDCSQDVMQTVKQNFQGRYDSDKNSNVFHSDKTDQKEKVSVRGRSLPPPPSGRGKKENGAVKSCVATEGDDALKGKNQTRKAENENGCARVNTRDATPTLLKGRDIEAPSPLRKDSSSQTAATSMKEAKYLKHLADRLKNAGSNVESTGYYFQAALKFLHAASLIEPCNSENSKNGDQSMPIYSDTGKLCEYCAHEYERSKDMAGAALAYKCMEVAYMRVVYSSHTSASRDKHELQSVLQTVHPGESPSFASNVDVATRDNVSIAKGVNSPQVAGNHGISAKNRPNFVRLLNFAQDVNLAMEASRKSWIAFTSANVGLDGSQHKEVISSIKEALDFGFQDVEGFLRLVRLATEAISSR